MKRHNQTESLASIPLPRLRDAVDLSSCLDAFEAQLKQLVGDAGYFINLYQSVDNTLVCSRTQLPPSVASVEQTFAQYAFPVDGENVNAMVFTSGEVVSITHQNLAHFPQVTRVAFDRWNICHMAVLPLQSSTQKKPAIGTLMLFSQTVPLEERQLQEISALITETVGLLRLHQEIANWEARAHLIRDTEAELQSMLRFVAEMSNLTTDVEIYPRIQREFLSRFSLDIAAVLIADEHSLRCVDTLFDPPDLPWRESWEDHCNHLTYAFDITDGASSTVYLNNHLLFFGDIPAILHLAMSEKDRANLTILDDLKSFGILPIRKQGIPIGVLWLGSLRRKNAMSADQLAQAQHLCDFLGAVIENARTYTLVEQQKQKIELLATALQSRVDVLDQLASRDRLTGLYNFGSFEIEARKQLTTRHEHPELLAFSLIICDVDHFKRFNDSFGHVAGNVVLQEVAQRIAHTVRNNDFVARYGGEEFVVLLGRCALEAAIKLAERIRESICDTPIIVDGIEHRITLSLGCTEAIDSDDTASLVARADTALYVAKQSGRNRVEPSAT